MCHRYMYKNSYEVDPSGKEINGKTKPVVETHSEKGAREH